MLPNYESVDCKTLDDFWSVVSPIGDKFGRPGSAFIFRGQGNSERLAEVPNQFAGGSA